MAAKAVTVFALLCAFALATGVAADRKEEASDALEDLSGDAHAGRKLQGYNYPWGYKGYKTYTTYPSGSYVSQSSGYGGNSQVISDGAGGTIVQSGRKLLQRGVNQANQANGSRNINQSNLVQANRSRNVNLSNLANQPNLVLANRARNVNQSNQANRSRNVNQSNLVQANRSGNINQSNQANGSSNVNQSNQANGFRG